MFLKHNNNLKNFAKQMRKNSTEAEILFWQFWKKNFSDFNLNKQKPINNFIVDFYCAKLKLIIEIDGKVHDLQEEKYKERDVFLLEKFNLKTLRFTNEDILNNLKFVKSRIIKFIEQNPPNPPFTKEKQNSPKFSCAKCYKYIFGKGGRGIFENRKMNNGIFENKNITNYSTFKLKTIAKYFCEVNNLEQFKSTLDFAKANKLDYEIIGGGSNTIFANNYLNKLIILNKIENKLIFNEDDNRNILVKVASGVNWDYFVREVALKNYFGIENLSFIPGTVGGAIVQNAGAYGLEIKDILLECEAYDLERNKIIIFNNQDCNFSYRNSIFKNNKRYFVLSGTFKLNKNINLEKYPKEIIEKVKEKFFNFDNLKVINIYEIIKEIRQNKLPDVSKINNVGSFFKNPIIDKNQLLKILEKYPEIIYYEIDKNRVKLGAGKLLELLGYKGFSFGHFGTYEKHALSLIHKGGGDFTELKNFINLLKEKVKQEFGVDIEEEVVFIK